MSSALFDKTSKDAGNGLAKPQTLDERRRILDALNSLRNTSTLVDLPRIIVIGSQSAGKTSLIEAISGITLPRVDTQATPSPDGTA